MIMNRFNGADIMMTVDGKEIGAIQTLKLKADNDTIEEKENTLRLYDLSRHATITMQDVQFHKGFLDLFTERDVTYTVKGRGHKLPRGNKLPKKKRLRKKWSKKYGYDFELGNCIILGKGR